MIRILVEKFETAGEISYKKTGGPHYSNQVGGTCAGVPSNIQKGATSYWVDGEQLRGVNVLKSLRIRLLKVGRGACTFIADRGGGERAVCDS